MSPLSLLALSEPAAVITEQIAAPVRDVRVEQAPQPRRPTLTVPPIAGRDLCAKADDAECLAAPETSGPTAPTAVVSAAPSRAADPPAMLNTVRRATAERDAQMLRDAQALRDALGSDVAKALTPPPTPGP